MQYSLEAFPLGIPGYSAGILRMASRYYYDDASLLMLWSAWGVTSQMNHERNAFKKTHLIPIIFKKNHQCNIVYFFISQNDNFWLKIRQFHIKKRYKMFWAVWQTREDGAKVYRKVSNGRSEELADINVISTKLKTPKMDNQVKKWDGNKTGSGLIKLTVNYSTDRLRERCLD